jgi:hypothetical protein
MQLYVLFIELSGYSIFTETYLSTSIQLYVFIYRIVWLLYLYRDILVPVYNYVLFIELSGYSIFVETYWLIDWLIDCCLTSSEQFFSYIQDENI